MSKEWFWPCPIVMIKISTASTQQRGYFFFISEEETVKKGGFKLRES